MNELENEISYLMDQVQALNKIIRKQKDDLKHYEDIECDLSFHLDQIDKLQKENQELKIRMKDLANEIINLEKKLSRYRKDEK